MGLNYLESLPSQTGRLTLSVTMDGTKMQDRMNVETPEITNNGSRPPSESEIVAMLNDRKDRTARAAKEIGEILKRERCEIQLQGLAYRKDGGFNPIIQIAAIE